MRRLAPSGLGGEEFGEAAMAREWILGHLAEARTSTVLHGDAVLLGSILRRALALDANRCTSILDFFLSNASNRESQLTGFWISEDDFGTTSVIGATYPLIPHRGEAWRDSGLTSPDISARNNRVTAQRSPSLIADAPFRRPVSPGRRPADTPFRRHISPRPLRTTWNH
jgi:hypothetical protein